MKAESFNYFSVAFCFYSAQSVKSHQSCSPLHSLVNLHFALDKKTKIAST